MNALLMAKTAYATTDAPTRTPRSTEYEAFARITHRLKAASQLGREGFTQLAEAIHANRQLWNVLAADVADSANALPEAIRARIFYLAEFTNHHSHQVLAGQDTADTLVEINTAIMRGLRGQGAAS